MQEVENIIRILKEASLAFSKNDSFALRKLSDQTIHSSAIYQDADNIMVAVLVYVLSKLVEKSKMQRQPEAQEFYKKVSDNLSVSIKSLEKKDLEKFRESMGETRNAVNKIEGGLSEYIREIFYKAGINKAFRIYEHGVSAERTAELLGISLWDLASYIGQSSVSESHFSEAIPVSQRIKLTEDFFK